MLCIHFPFSFSTNVYCFLNLRIPGTSPKFCRSAVWSADNHQSTLRIQVAEALCDRAGVAAAVLQFSTFCIRFVTCAHQRINFRNFVLLWVQFHTLRWANEEDEPIITRHYSRCAGHSIQRDFLHHLPICCYWTIALDVNDLFLVPRK